MNRQDLQLLSELRVTEAKILLAAGYYSGSYYLMGYSIECAIKSIIAKKTQQYDFPNKDLALNSYSHDYTRLIQTAGLWNAFTQAIAKNQQLQLNWLIVKDWNEGKRYTNTITSQEAQDFHDACTDLTNGVLQWLKNYW
jgi:hypothetical protein